MVEGARLERVYRGNSIEGSNPSLTATQSPLPQNRVRRSPKADKARHLTTNASKSARNSSPRTRHPGRSTAGVSARLRSSRDSLAQRDLDPRLVGPAFNLRLAPPLSGAPVTGIDHPARLAPATAGLSMQACHSSRGSWPVNSVVVVLSRAPMMSSRFCFPRSVVSARPRSPRISRWTG